MGRCMGDADPKLEPPARNLMQIGGGLGELIDRLRIDRRYGGGKWNALGRQCEPDALHMLPKELDTEIPAKPRRSISRDVALPGSRYRVPLATCAERRARIGDRAHSICHRHSADLCA